MNTALPPYLPITEAELHAHLDGQLPPEREHEVHAYLAQHPAEATRLAAYRAQQQGLRSLYDPILHEAAPERLRLAALPPQRPAAQRWVAGVLLAVLSGAAGWGLHAATEHRNTAAALAPPAAFAQRAAVAHAVYSPDQRRPVEVDAAHEEQLVAWLSKRLGTPLKPPQLQALGYALQGGRLLPGAQGPVAQFMYQDSRGAKLTLYVSNEARGGDNGTGFQYSQHGAVKVFYWVDGPFGYALSADTDRATLAQLAQVVYQQLTAPR